MGPPAKCSIMTAPMASALSSSISGMRPRLVDRMAITAPAPADGHRGPPAAFSRGHSGARAGRGGCRSAAPRARAAGERGWPTGQRAPRNDPRAGARRTARAPPGAPPGSLPRDVADPRRAYRWPRRTPRRPRVEAGNPSVRARRCHGSRTAGRWTLGPKAGGAGNAERLMEDRLASVREQLQEMLVAEPREHDEGGDQRLMSHREVVVVVVVAV